MVRAQPLVFLKFGRRRQVSMVTSVWNTTPLWMKSGSLGLVVGVGGFWALNVSFMSFQQLTLSLFKHWDVIKPEEL